MSSNFSAEHFRTFFAFAPLGIAVADAGGRFLEANQAFLDMLGYRPEDLRGLTFDDVTHPEDRAEIERLRGEILAGRIDSYCQKKRCLANDGRCIWVIERMRALRGPGGGFGYWMGIIEDISERVTAEKERERLTAQVRQLQKMEALGPLARMIAHEYNNILMGIQGNVSLLLFNKPTDHKEVPYLRKIEKAVERAAGLTRQLLGVARSHPGSGTTLPVFPPAAGERQPIAEPPPAGRPGGTQTVLLVEDDEVVAEIGVKMLRRLGYRVILARGGRQALSVYREHGRAIALVILDVVMPEMSGSETFERLMKIDPQVRVLLASGYALDGQAQVILKRGCLGFIQKPFSLETLAQKIEAALASG